MLINPFRFTPAGPVEGDLEIIYGNERHSTVYEGVVNYYDEYCYSCHFIEASRLTAIPNNAKIYKIQFQVDNSAPSGSVYTESAIDMWMGCTQASSFNAFPSDLLVNLNSDSDGAWNNDISAFGKTKVISNGSRTYIHSSTDPDINHWVDVDFDVDFNYTAGMNLCYSLMSNSGEYTSGSSVNPKHKGVNMTGTQPNKWAQDGRMFGSYQETSTVNFDGTFLPNVKIFWS